MRGRAGILSPRPAPASLPDLAERTTFMTGQRERHRRRRHARRRLVSVVKFAGALLLLMGTAASLAVGLHWSLTSPRFAVARIEVKGAQRLTDTELLSAAGIAPGENLFRLDGERVRARLMRLPPVKRAEVIRSFPNRVTLVVEERVPFTLAQAGHLYWLDENGVSLGPEPRAVAPRLPVLTGLLPEELGEAPPAERARAAISLIRSLVRTGSALTREISEIDMSRPDGPVLYTVEGVEVRLGNSDWEGRLARLDGVLPQITSMGGPVEYVDLRFKGQVVFKPLAR